MLLQGGAVHPFTLQAFTYSFAVYQLIIYVHRHLKTEECTSFNG